MVLVMLPRKVDEIVERLGCAFAFAKLFLSGVDRTTMMKLTSLVMVKDRKNDEIFVIVPYPLGAVVMV